MVRREYSECSTCHKSPLEGQRHQPPQISAPPLFRVVPCAAAPLTIVTTPNIPPVVAPQRKANHHTMGLEAFIAAFPPNEVKYVKKKSVRPNKPALTHLHNDGLGRVVQEQEWINRSSMRRGHSCLPGFVLVAPKKKGSDAYFSWRPH